MIRLGLILALLATGSATAQSLGTVVSYNVDELRVFDEAGQPLPKVRKADLPKGPPIARMGPGGSVGIQYAGRLIFLRGIDVTTSQASGPCAKATPATRPSGQVYGGTTMGIGSGQTRNCTP